MGIDSMSSSALRACLAGLYAARVSWAIAALCLVLALAFLGLRGIWDPDEGRYTNVALNMLETGDWFNPMRNEDTGHWTKPPLTYWMIAGSVAVFGQSPWGARFPIAISYIACMVLTALCARRLAPSAVGLSVVVYATMLVPFVAGQLVTTDFPLSALQALAMYAFVEYRFGTTKRYWLWLVLMWIALAAGFMTKGPPALVPLVVVLAMCLMSPGKPVRWYWHLAGVTLFLVIALPWYIAVSLRHDGLLQYFLGAELIDRVASNRFGRHGEWYGWLQVYGPTLVLGTLPWTLDLWRWFRQLPARVAQLRDRALRQSQPDLLLLLLWILVPLVIFCLARSRLPLYLLPIFVPIAIAIATQRSALGKGIPRWYWLGAWVLLLLGSRVAAAHFPTHKDSSKWAEAISERTDGPVTEVVFVEDMARYGLRLHLGAEIEKLSILPKPQPRFNPEFDEPLMQEVVEVDSESGLIFVTKTEAWPGIAQKIERHGYEAKALGDPYQNRIIFEVMRSAAYESSDELGSGASMPSSDVD